MVFYAGETIMFKTSAVDVDDAGTPITDADVTSTEILIIDQDGATVEGPAPLTWDATDAEWRYAWTTAASGRFTARLRLIGNTFDTWEFKRVTIRPNLDPFTIP